jgi:hypothetical protein
LVDRDHHRLELEREPPFFEELNAAATAVIGAGDAGERLISLARSTVERDLDGEGTPLCPIVGEAWRDQGAVREERDDEPLLFRIGIDVQEILPGQDFPAGKEQLQAAHLRQFIQDSAELADVEFALPGRRIVHGQIVVAVCAGEGAAACQLNGHVRGNTLCAEPSVQREAECPIRLLKDGGS